MNHSVNNKLNVENNNFIAVLNFLPKWAWVVLAILLAISIQSSGFWLSVGAILMLAGVALLVSYAIKRKKVLPTKNIKSLAIGSSVAMMVVGTSIVGAVTPPSTGQSKSDATNTQQAVEPSREKQELPKVNENLAQDPHYKDGIKEKVVGVVDGDTMSTENNRDIRLIGINAPKREQANKVAECFAAEALQKLNDLVKDKMVYLVADNTYDTKDADGRKFFYVYLEDGTNISYYLINEGYAREFTGNSKVYKWQEKFVKAQELAKNNKRGLWGDNTCAGDTVSVAEKKAAAETEARKKQEEAQRAAEAAAIASRQAELQRRQQQHVTQAAPQQPATGPVFSSCKQARAAGYSHMRRGEPGYSSHLDRDGDGIACDKRR